MNKRYGELKHVIMIALHTYAKQTQIKITHALPSSGAAEDSLYNENPLVSNQTYAKNNSPFSKKLLQTQVLRQIYLTRYRSFKSRDLTGLNRHGP